MAINHNGRLSISYGIAGIILISSAASTVAQPLFTYISGPNGCTRPAGYPDAALCVIPNETPLVTFPVPGAGGMYVDPTFGATVKILSSFSANHGYSTPSAFSATGKYAAIVQYNAQVNVVESATGRVAYVGRPGSVTFETVHWDSYSDDIYYFVDGSSRLSRHTLSTNTTLTLVDYATDGHKFTKLYQGGTGDMSKDNWLGFAAPNEHQVCIIDLNSIRTYCADYSASYPGSNIGVSFLDFVNVARGVDSVTGKRYVLLMANPSIAVFSVNQSTGKLDFEYRGPELPIDMQSGGSGNHNNICDPGENCLAAFHSDTMEDAQGKQYLVYVGDMETPCQRQITTSLLSKGLSMLIPVSHGGGRTDVMPISLCGGGPIEAWTENHIGCARKTPSCVVSTNNISRDPTDLTSPIVRTTHLSELIVMRGNGTEIRRLAETRSPNFTNDNYWSLAKASMSQDGSLVAWDSNFGYPNRGEAVAMAYTGYGPIYPPAPVLPVPPAPFTPIRIHSGGPAYTDPSGLIWSADNGFADGSAHSVNHAISGTTTPVLYQTERSGNFQYQFVVPNGTYTVKLKFAEISMTQAGQRVFNVDINGYRVLKNFDIVAAAGAAFAAIDESFPVATTTGSLMIQFSSVVDVAKISSIEIFQGTPPPASPGSSSSTIRVNAGGSAFTDPSGKVWSADTNYAGGSAYTSTHSIQNTTTPTLYQTERYAATFQYIFSVPNGTYSVNLKFAENYMTQTGERVFNVAINGTPVLTNFDIISAAGAPFTAIDKPFTVSTTTGIINIQFTAVVNYAKISAIEIVPGSAPAPPPAQGLIRVNAGGPAYADSSGNVWSADKGYSGGSIYTTAKPIKNTVSPTLYQTERWASTFQYQFSVPNGAHTVNLKFADIYMTLPGQRIFNVAINGSPVLTNFDIVAQAGPMTAIDKAFSVNTTTGSITIQFTSVVNHAKISAIEIH